MNSKALYTSVLSGKFKGKKLLLPSLATTRSTKNIVKSCVFNTIRTELTQSIFIEVFAGSASLAIEALSNYALKSFGIEKDQKAYEIACKNSHKLENIQIFKGDSFELLPSLLDRFEQDFILYFDPPFDFRSGFEQIYEKIFKLIQSLTKKAKLIIIEHTSEHAMPENIKDYKLYKSEKFGNTSLSFYR